MSGRAGLASSRAFIDHSDVDDDSEDLADSVSDEEAEVLLWDSSLGNASGNQLNGDEDYDTAALADSILDDMQRLQIGVPKLEDVIMGVVVNFWDEDPRTDGAASVTFVLETSEIEIPNETLRSFCRETHLAPMRIRIPIACDDEEEVVTEEEEEESDDDAKLEIIDDDDVEDEFPRQWIPARGYVNVLISLYGQAPVVAGLLSEGYDLSDDPPAGPHNNDLDTFNNHGKRIVWIDSAERTMKRARGENGDVATQSRGDDDAIPADGMSGFVTEPNAEWTNKMNRHDVVCSFEREAGTGVLKEVRLALALHAPRMRAELQAILAMSRNTM